MNQAVKLEILDAHAVLTLNRPDKHNAFDDLVIQELLAALEQVKNDTNVRVLLLQSSGKSFSAGADLNWMKRMAELDHQANLEDALQLARLMRTLNDLPIPTIAKVQGAAYGGAIGLISCCDIAIASDKARFCLSEVKLGLSPATIGPFVVRAMGARRCRALFLSAELFNARRAYEWSLVHNVVSHEQLDEACERAQQDILATGPNASIASKKLIAAIEEGLEDEAQYTARLIADLRVSEEGQVGLKAFFNKERPPWAL